MYVHTHLGFGDGTSGPCRLLPENEEQEASLSRSYSSPGLRSQQLWNALPAPAPKGSRHTHPLPSHLLWPASNVEENLKRSFVFSCSFLLKAPVQYLTLKFDYCYYLRLFSRLTLTAKWQIIPGQQSMCKRDKGTMFVSDLLSYRKLLTQQKIMATLMIRASLMNWGRTHGIPWIEAHKLRTMLHHSKHLVSSQTFWLLILEGQNATYPSWGTPNHQENLIGYYTTLPGYQATR